MNKLINSVVNFLEEARIKHNVNKSDLEKDGAVIYANGNDGTDFDWAMNDCLCEIGYGTRDGNAWAFKMYVNKEGKASIYCYPNGELMPVDTMEKQIMTRFEANEFYELMLSKADYHNKYDCTFDEIFGDDLT